MRAAIMRAWRRRIEARQAQATTLQAQRRFARRVGAGEAPPGGELGRGLEVARRPRRAGRRRWPRRSATTSPRRRRSGTALLMPSARGARADGDRRFAGRRLGGQPVVGLPRRDVPAQRAHAAAAWPRASRPTRRPRRASASRCEQWIDAAAPSNYLALNPEAQKKAIETKGESIAHGPAASSGTTCSRATCRRPTRARSRSAATSPPPRARWSSRTSSSSCSNTSR